MRSQIICAAIAVAALGLSAAAQAADAVPAPPPVMDQWTGKGALGAVFARGNSDATTISAALDAQELTGNWKYQAGFSALKADTSRVNSADRYEFHGQANYSFTPQSYAFGSGRYDNDRFSAYDSQISATGGYGRQWISDPALKFSTELGLGIRRSKLRVDGSTESDAIIRGAAAYEQALSDTTKLSDKFLMEAGRNDVFMTNDLGLAVKMTTALAISLDYQIRNHSKTPGPDVKHLDQLFTANIVFAF